MQTVESKKTYICKIILKQLDFMKLNIVTEAIKYNQFTVTKFKK